MQPLENLFSSPLKPETNGNHDSGSEDMDISSSGGPGPDTLLRNQRNAKLPVPRSRSPLKTTLGSPPRKMAPPRVVERVPSPADDASAPRSLQFDASFDDSADVTGPGPDPDPLPTKPNGFGPNGVGDGSTLDLGNNSVEESVLLLDAVNRQNESFEEDSALAAVPASQDVTELEEQREEAPSQPAEQPVKRRRGRPRRQDRPVDNSQSSQPTATKKRRSSRTSLVAEGNDADASQQAPMAQDQRKAKRQRTKGPSTATSMAPPPLPPPERPAPAARYEVDEEEEADAAEAMEREHETKGTGARQKHAGRRQKTAETHKKHDEGQDRHLKHPEGPADKHAKRQNKHAEDGNLESRTSRAEKRRERAVAEPEDAELHKKKGADGRHKTVTASANKPGRAEAAENEDDDEDEEPKPRRKGRPARKDKAPGDASFMALQRGPPMPKSRGLVSVRRDDEAMTLTRSGRHSYRPVQYWRGEQVICEDEEQNDMFHNRGDFVLPTIKEVVRVPPEAPPSKRGTRSGGRTRTKQGRQPEEEEELEEWEVSQGVMTGEVVIWEPEHEEHPPGEDEPVQVMRDRIAISSDAIQTSDIKDATFRFAKTLTTPFMGSGVVDLPPGAEKRPKNSRKMHMVFFVHYGKVLVTLNETQFRITAGGTWFVPRGNYYSITNDYDSPSRIFFAQACEVHPPRPDANDGSATDPTPS